VLFDTQAHLSHSH